MDFEEHSSDQGLKKGAVWLVYKLGEGKLAGAVDGNIQMRPIDGKTISQPVI